MVGHCRPSAFRLNTSNLRTEADIREVFDKGATARGGIYRPFGILLLEEI